MWSRGFFLLGSTDRISRLRAGVVAHTPGRGGVGFGKKLRQPHRYGGEPSQNGAKDYKGDRYLTQIAHELFARLSCIA
jgi:hypothetical protein